MNHREWLAPHRWVESAPPPQPAVEQAPALADLIGIEDILLDLEVAGKDQLFAEIGRHMECEHGLPQAWVSEALARREGAGSTGLGRGVAIPHARVGKLKQIQVAYLRLRQGIPFAAPDARPVSDVLVLLVPKQATEDHLAILAEAAQWFSDPVFRERLHTARDAAEIKRLFDSRNPRP